MLLELGLWVVCLNTAVVLGVTARRSLRAQSGYALLLFANMLLSAFLLATSNADSVLSFVSIGAFVCMVLLPPVLSRITRWAVHREYMGLAVGLTTVRELLQPGASMGFLKRALKRLSRVVRGETDEVIRELEAVKGTAPEEVQRAIDMEILSVLLSARRWSEAIAHFDESVELEATVFHPPLAARLVQAFGQEGRLDRMGHVMQLTEDSPAAADPANADALTLARLSFLAHTGQVKTLRALLSPTSGFAQDVGKGLRAYWLGLALKARGDGAAAVRELDRAEVLLSGRTIVAQVKKLRAEARKNPSPVNLDGDPALQSLVDKVARKAMVQASLPRLRGGSPLRLMPVTLVLIAVNVGVWVTMHIVGLGPTHYGTLIAAGANLKAAVNSGQYYRLVSSTFLHAPWVHLALNMLVLWILGRLAEQLLGSLRFWIVYLLAGVTGSVASFALGEAPLSVGASGAIFGLVGASVAALALGRDRWPEAWRRSMIVLLIILGLLGLLPGLTIRVVDNWAHVGGLVGGGLCAAAVLTLSPRETVSWAVRGAAALVLLLTLWAAADTLRNPNDTLPWKRHKLGPYRVSVPVTFHPTTRNPAMLKCQDMLSGSILLALLADTGQDPSAGLDGFLAREKKTRRKQALEEGAKFQKNGPELVNRVPPGWVSTTLFYRSENTDFVHGMFITRAGLSAPLLIINVLTDRRRVKQVRPIVERLLKRVR